MKKFKLIRLRDGKGLVGDIIEIYPVLGKDDNKILGEISNSYTSEDYPNLYKEIKIGHCINILYGNDNWMTTTILEKLEYKKDYIKFKTEYSIYDCIILKAKNNKRLSLCP